MWEKSCQGILAIYTINEKRKGEACLVKKLLLVLLAFSCFFVGVNAAQTDYNYSDLNLTSIAATASGTVITVTSVGDFNHYDDAYTPPAPVNHDFYVAKGVPLKSNKITQTYYRRVGTKIQMRDTIKVNQVAWFKHGDNPLDCNSGSYFKIFAFGDQTNPEGVELLSTNNVTTNVGDLVEDYCIWSFGTISLIKDLNYLVELTMQGDGYPSACAEAYCHNEDINGTFMYRGDTEAWVYTASFVPVFQLNLTERRFRLECGSATGLADLCASDYSSVSNPSCSFNGSIGNNDVYCRLRRTCSDCVVTASRELSGSVSADANVVVTASISPAAPLVSDNLVPTVTLTFPDASATVDGNYTWQNRINWSHAWTTYSKAGMSGLCTGSNPTGLTCTVPTISSTDTNAGNFWRLVIDTNNSANNDTTQAIAQVGIETTTDFITNIENVTHVEDFNEDNGNYDIILNPTTEVNDFIFKAFNNDLESITLDYDIYNSLNDLRQYFIYVADKTQYDANTWVFSDYLTYGSATTYDDPIQKIWDENSAKYKYEVSDTLDVNETKYYKLAYRYPMRYWDSITDDEWWHQLAPQNFDVNGVSTDRYSVSVYSNVLSKIKPYLPDVDSNYTYAYELQFNAYADSAVSLTVGAWNDANNHAANSRTVAVTATEKRYSIDVEAGDSNSLVYIKSNSTTANNIYFSNVVLVQRAYFKTRLEVIKANYEPLDVFITDVNGTSYRYVDEGVPFRFKTQIYDRDGTVRIERVSVYAYAENDTNKIVVQDVNLVENYETENTIDLSGLINGLYLIHDANVADGNDFYSRVPVLVKVLISDNNGSTFVETGTWIKMHEFPFFYTDFFLQTQEQGRVLNTAPHGRIFAQSRVPANIEDIEMYIYDGSWFCPPWMINLNIQCNAENTAADVNKAFVYKFYKQDSCADWTNSDAGCFTCDGENCGFNYSLEGLFHYAIEGPHTTFSFMHFNTSDNNTYMSRTIYDIGQQDLVIRTEVQGLDANAYDACDSNLTVAGSQIGILTTYETIYAELRDNTVIQDQLASGKITYQDIADFSAYYCGASTGVCNYLGLPTILSFGNPVRDFLGWVGCGPTITSTTALKITAEVYTPLLEDIHLYESIWFQLTPCDGTLCTPDVNQFSNRFYPVTSFYEFKTGKNIFTWNTVLYDENGVYLHDLNYFRIDFYGIDGTYRFNDIDTDGVDDGNILVYIDDSFSVSEPAGISFMPIVYGASYEDTFNLRSYVSTSNKYMDKIELVLYTDYSSYDTTKSDKENQIIRVEIGYEDVLALKNDLNFDAMLEFNQFKYDNIKAKMFSLCATGGLAAVTSGISGTPMLLSTDGELVKTGMGLPGDTSLFGAVTMSLFRGCGTGDVTSWGAGDPLYLVLDGNYASTYSNWQVNDFKEIDLVFENMHINDFDYLLESNELTEDDSSPATIISDLAELGETAYSEPLIIRLAGKKYEFENVLVGISSKHAELSEHDLKIRINVYYDYFSKVAVKDIDLANFRTDEGDFLGQLNDWFKLIFNAYAPLLLGGVLILVVVVFAVRGFSRRRE